MPWRPSQTAIKRWSSPSAVRLNVHGVRARWRLPLDTVERALEEPADQPHRDRLRLELGEIQLMRREWEVSIEALIPVVDASESRELRVRAVEALTECYGYGLHQWSSALRVTDQELSRSTDFNADDHLSLEALRSFFFPSPIPIVSVIHLNSRRRWHGLRHPVREQQQSVRPTR